MWYTDNSNFGGQNDEIFIRKRDSDAPYAPQPVQYFLTEGVLRRWRYSPPECSRVVETVFGE